MTTEYQKPVPRPLSPELTKPFWEAANRHELVMPRCQKCDHFFFYPRECTRMVNDPLHLLECVMPCAGAAACIVTSAERAKSLPNPPVYILGAAAGVSGHDTIWQADRITTSPVVISARKALEMSGYSPKDITLCTCWNA